MKERKTDPDREWKLDFFEEIITHPFVKKTTWQLAQHMREPDDPSSTYRISRRRRAT